MTQPIITISLLAIPETYMSCLSGLYDVLTVSSEVLPGRVPFHVEIVAQAEQVQIGKSRMPVMAHRKIDDIAMTDVVIVPTSVVGDEGWAIGCYPDIVEWLKRLYCQGTVLCSTCSGVLLLAETGLLNGRDATTHWTLKEMMKAHFPKVNLRLERELIVTGDDDRLIMSGASSAWHDLALYLIARYAGPATAQAAAKFFMLQWHANGQTPYLTFQDIHDHSDAPILKTQVWLQEHWRDPNPVEGMVQESGLPERTFKRRFQEATGLPPIKYVQYLRVEKAKQYLENSEIAIDEISWKVGYEDPSFFRRLFKRIVNVAPGNYRRMFRAPR
ncbi:MAG TPA: helix-turn-helix domain-containing protein [Leptolyngbyaceae cyanobacterium M33_DOE_097]|uniref:Helix-turn-helix domain-containing protein n=1 Tax=Oscillatoriales cyanobacterium SpSt-418 TaxID=2282169 RepID=A0A7C3PI07_9CYAN|nr:helix-turn-helix domain-containing protein [Leptolyngbyaceae cyanobacterium M33_DOE_097]